MPGPAALGRGLVITAGTAVPAAWSGAPLVNLGGASLDEPGPVVASLHASWAARRPVVIELALEPGRFRAPQSWAVEPWTVDPGFEVWYDRLHFLVWANAYDGRDGELRWWWAVKAGRVGAECTPDGPADVHLPDGTPAWIDGGPRGPLDRSLLGTGAVLVHAESVELGRLTPSPQPVPPAADLAP
ncbi:MAG: hypothetical protein WKF43_12975, partial [Acidimicrobiales bacterium]